VIEKHSGFVQSILLNTVLMFRDHIVYLPIYLSFNDFEKRIASVCFVVSEVLICIMRAAKLNNPIKSAC